MARPEWKLIQENTFRRWCTQSLKSRGIDINDLATDFSDGVQLVALLEVLSQKKLGRYNKNPKLRAQKLENCGLCLDFIKSEGLHVVNIGNEDIVDGNLKLILGLVWTLILHYQINIGFQEDSKSEEQESESKLSPKQALLSWIQKKLPDKNIRNFTRDWQSGINVAALVDAVSPGVCPEHAAMDESMALENARLAMARAEEWLTIPQVLTPEDLISPGVDELSVMTYLSFFPDCKPKPGAPLLSQASPEQKTAVSPVAVEETVALPEMASLNEQEPDFVKLEPDSSEQEPTEEIDKLDAEEDEEDAPDAPFDPLSWKAFGPGLEDVVHAHDEAEFTIQIGSGRPNELKVKVMNTSMGVMELPVEIKRDDDSTYKVTYSTAEPGQYQISILVSGVDIAGSPFKIVVLDLTKVQVKGPKTNINVGEIATYHVDASFAGPGHITVTLVMPDDNQQQCHITEISAGKYKAEIVPEQCGKHQLSVLFAGIPVLRQPLILDVQEQESGQPDIDLDVVEAKSGRHLVTLSQVSVDAEIRAVKNIIYQNYPKVHVNRIQLRIESRGKGLKDDDSIDSLGLKRGSKLYLKDLGPQIGWKTVFVAEYLGPLLIYPIFYARPELIYGEGASSMPYHGVVKIAAACWTLHYAKRVFETLCVHRFSHATMPLWNLFKNCLYYWGFAGLIGYFVNHPLYTPPAFGSTQIGLGLFGFMICEYGNFAIHSHLRDLRPPGSTERQIPFPSSNPFTWLFNYVSCPNYTYEFGAWLSFTGMTQTLTAGIFTLAGLYQMTAWAIGKHKNYKREFSEYPGKRKTILPFVI